MDMDWVRIILVSLPSAASGVIPEASDGSGFNIEGITMSPDNAVTYIAFRAPISPANNRTRALIVPLTNIASLVSGNPAAGPATFGAADIAGPGRKRHTGDHAECNQWLYHHCRAC
jgi:hypothetical protein